MSLFRTGAEAMGDWQKWSPRPPFIGNPVPAVDPNNSVNGSGSSTGTNPIVITIPPTKANQIVFVQWAALGVNTGCGASSVIVSGGPGAPVAASGQGTGWRAAFTPTPPAAIAANQHRALLVTAGYTTITLTATAATTNFCALVFVMGTSQTSIQLGWNPTPGSPNTAVTVNHLTNNYSPSNIVAMSAVTSLAATVNSNSTGAITVATSGKLFLYGAKKTISPTDIGGSMHADTGGIPAVWGINAEVYQGPP